MSFIKLSKFRARKNRMRLLPYVIVAAGLGGAALTAGSSWVSPLSSGLARSDLIQPVMSSSLVQKVHNRHCRERKGLVSRRKAMA
jgi:hypothetical protein